MKGTRDKHEFGMPLFGFHGECGYWGRHIVGRVAKLEKRSLGSEIVRTAVTPLFGFRLH